MRLMQWIENGSLEEHKNGSRNVKKDNKLKLRTHSAWEDENVYMKHLCSRNETGMRMLT